MHTLFLSDYSNGRPFGEVNEEMFESDAEDHGDL
jgi:hypothetical protein